jgi:hypothetical protein
MGWGKKYIICVFCYEKTKGKERVFYLSLASQVTASHLTPDTWLQPRYSIIEKTIKNREY